MILTNESKRLVIFLFFDPNGVVDDYIPYMLKDIKKNVNEIFVVSNGRMNDEGKDKLQGIADTVWERENKGFDVWGYKEALEYIGWDKLSAFDEVIMMNYTIMGPVDTFDTMFREMAEKDLDFWGITKFHMVPFDPYECIECGYIHEHLQSHFIAVRKSMFTSEEYKHYWDTMPMVSSYKESIAFHETRFTFTFEELGYKWEPYVDTTDLETFNYNPIIKCARKLVEEKKCPIFKRRSFMHNYDDMLYDTLGESSYELYEYLDKNTNYDVNMIWDNLLRCNNMAAIKDCLHLNYILPSMSKVGVDETSLRSKMKVALVFHAYFVDLLDSTYHYVNSMPEWADVYITTDSEEKKELIEKKFVNNKFNHLEVIQIENRGRDVSALLVATKSFIMNYDLVCFAHDKKVTQIKMGSVGASFAYHCLENTLGTEQYVYNVLDLFEKNPRMGLLTPMPPYHGDYYMTMGYEWSKNYNVAKVLAEQLELKVDISEEYAPIAPLGTMFWFRTKGMKRLFDCNWEYSDFPKEPNRIDGTLLHAIERIYGYVVQNAGYYCGWCSSDKGAAINTTNMYYMLSEYNKVFRSADVTGTHVHVLDEVKKIIGSTGKLKDAASVLVQSYPEIFGSLPSGAITTKVYLDIGKGFDEKFSYLVGAPSRDGELKIVFKLPTEIKTLSNIRLDPGEHKGVEVKDFKVTYRYKNRNVEAKEDFCSNGLQKKNTFLLLSDDPQISWKYTEDVVPNEIVFEAKVITDIPQEDIIEMSKMAFVKPSLFRRAIRKIFRLLRK